MYKKINKYMKITSIEKKKLMFKHTERINEMKQLKKSLLHNVVHIIHLITRNAFRHYGESKLKFLIRAALMKFRDIVLVLLLILKCGRTSFRTEITILSPKPETETKNSTFYSAEH